MDLECCATEAGRADTKNAGTVNTTGPACNEHAVKVAHAPQTVNKTAFE